MHHRRRADGLEFALIIDRFDHVFSGGRVRNFRQKCFRFVDHRKTGRQRVRFFEIVDDDFRRFARAEAGQRLRRCRRQIGVFWHRKQILDDLRLFDGTQAVDKSQLPIAVNRCLVRRSHRLDGPFRTRFLQFHTSRFANDRIRALKIL